MATLPDHAPRLLTPVPPELTGAQGALELLPMPAVLVDVLAAFRFEATNEAFRQAGLGDRADRSPLVRSLRDRLCVFVHDELARDTFPWTLGEAIDARHYRATIARVWSRGEGRCLVTLVDETAQKRTEQSFRREMSTDSLTGLPNRAGFGDLLDAIRDDERPHYAVLMLDLERFSRVNMCMGSLAGDELLITVARRIKGALRAGDVLARTGGDEFAILLRVEAAGDADHVARRIRAAFAAPFRLSDFEFRVACSVGIAYGTEDIADGEDLIRHAQYAVKRSKESGQPECYRTQGLAAAREQFGMETALRRAIDGGELRLCYQPIYDLASGRLHSFEALARWTDEHGHRRSPADFIPVAEESGLILPLGRWALREALTTLGAWDVRAGGNCGVQVAVNVSPLQLQRDAMAPAVEEALAEAGVAGERLKLELTESALIAEPDRTARTLEALKRLGVTLAMDDFGTGYSNLALLQKLPIDALKIDCSLITGMLADRDKVAIVRAILSLAQALGMRTVAEGVETVELSHTLTALGCTYGQGFFYAPALERDDAYALLSAAATA